MGKPAFPFNPRWLTTPPAQLESTDIGMFLKWLDRNMGSMPADERMKARTVHAELRRVLGDRRGDARRDREAKRHEERQRRREAQGS